MVRAQRKPDLATFIRRAARGSDDDVELTCAGAAGKRLRRHAELLCQPESHAFALRGKYTAVCGYVKLSARPTFLMV